MLVGKNIVLRPLKIEDLEKTHEWRNNLELIKLTQGIRFPKSIEMDREWFETALSDKSNRNIYFGIDEKEANDFIGIIQLNNIDYISGTAFYGIIIGNKVNRGKGYATESTLLLLDYAFNVLNLRKIKLFVTKANQTAFELYKKIGFIIEGELKQELYFDNNYLDVVIMSIFRTNFNTND